MGEELKRAGDHLVYTHLIDLADALNAVPIKFTSLDGRTLVKSVDCIISPSTVLEISGEGMPIYVEADEKDVTKWGHEKRGDLFIRFDIQF